MVKMSFRRVALGSSVSRWILISPDSTNISPLLQSISRSTVNSSRKVLGVTNCNLYIVITVKFVLSLTVVYWSVLK